MMAITSAPPILLFLAFDQRETRGIDAIGRQAEFAPGAQALLRIRR
jgi:hypothetical protein